MQQEKKRYGYVYKIVFPNGNIYVGKHTPLENEDFYSYMGSGTYVKRYLKKHSKNTLQKIIINSGIYSEEELYELEYIFVRLCKKLYKDKCVNYCDGGSGFHKGYNHSDETKQKISEASKENWIKLKEEDKYEDFIKDRTEKRLDFLKNHPGFWTNVVKASWDNGNQTGMTGHHHTEEAKQIISEKLNGKEFSEEHKRHLSEAQKLVEHKPHTQKTKDKMSASQKGRLHITNGIQNAIIKQIDLIPDGWYIGWTAIKKCETVKSSQWINNGIIETYSLKSKSIPEGWTKGRLKRKWYTNGTDEKYCLEKEKPENWNEGRSEIYNKQNKYTKKRLKRDE